MPFANLSCQELHLPALRPSSVLVGDDGILEQSMRDDDIHAGEFEEPENVIEQRLAVDDDFQAKPLDVGAGFAGAGGRLAQLRDLSPNRRKNVSSFAPISRFASGHVTQPLSFRQ